MIKNFFRLGNMTSFEGISVLFYFGLIPLTVQSYIMGKYIYTTNIDTTSSPIAPTPVPTNGLTSYSGQEVVYNAPLAILGGVMTCIVLLVIWKIVCELLIILFRYFETNTKRDLQ